MKRCSRCGETKPLNDFHRNRARPDGFQSQCAECRRAAQRRYAQTPKARAANRYSSRAAWQDPDRRLQKKMKGTLRYASLRLERSQQRAREAYENDYLSGV